VSHKVYTHVASGSSSTYGAKDLCNAPANQTAPLKFINPGMIHRVTLRGLPPFTKIYYRVRHDEQPWGEEHVFRSRRPAAASSVRFLMYADQALPVPLVPHVAWRLVPQVVSDIEGGYDSFLLHPGDLGYAMGSGYIWDVWGALIEPISSRIPYMVTVGNHEYDHTGSRLDPSGAPSEGWHPPWGNFGDDSRGECGVPTAARFSGTGSSVAGANGVFWYSFDEGPVHVTMLSSEHEWTVGSRQYEWLAADLAAVDRAATPWIVLATHRMMYTTQLLEEADYNVSLAFRREVEPLLTRHKVNLMLVGHQHSYERSCAAFDGACVPPGEQGTVHLVVGSAGASLERGGFSPALGHFSLKHVNDWGYLRLDANASRLRLEWVRTDAHDGAGPGQVWDSVELLPWM